MFSNLTRRWNVKKEDGGFFYATGGGYSAFDDNDIIKDFMEIPELNSVINWKASAFRNARIHEVDKDGNIINENIDTFDKPNPFQARGEFMRQTKLFHELFGDEIMYVLSGINPKNIDKLKGLFTLQPNFVEVENKSKQPFWTMTEMPEVQYSMRWDGKKVPLDASAIIHLNDNRVMQEGERDYLRGTSKVVPLKPALNNIRAAYTARGTNLTESGPRGILSNGNEDDSGATIPMDGDEKKKIQKSMGGYGAGRKQKRNIITNLNLKWQAMGFSTAHLKAFEEVTANHHKVCDGFGLTVDIFSREKGSTFANKREAEKAAYQDTIIPEFNEWMDAINMHFGLENKKFAGTFTHLPVFQEDLAKRASAMSSAVTALDKAFTSGVISLEEYRTELDKYMLL